MLNDMEHSKKNLEEELQKTSEVNVGTSCKTRPVAVRFLYSVTSKLATEVYDRSATSCCPPQKACLTVEENIRLKSRLQVAEAEVGQRHGSSAEQDYEEVIQLLEAEIRDLKNQLAGKRQARGVEATKVTVYYSVLCTSEYGVKKWLDGWMLH